MSFSISKEEVKKVLDMKLSKEEMFQLFLEKKKEADTKKEDDEMNLAKQIIIPNKRVYNLKITHEDESKLTFKTFPALASHK